MIRRGFWLATGAALGVAGYRKATRLARALTGTARGPAPPAAGRGAQRHGAAQPGSDGTLTDRQGDSAPARPRGPVDRVASAAGFVRDVREGMAEYWDLHRWELARTLESRGGRNQHGSSAARDRRTSEP